MGLTRNVAAGYQNFVNYRQKELGVVNGGQHAGGHGLDQRYSGQAETFEVYKVVMLYIVMSSITIEG
jgi:hypothetical protein